jgi:hypothetical protein
MREIDLPKENLRDTRTAVLGRSSLRGRMLPSRKGRKLVEEHPGISPILAKRDYRQLGPNGPYDASSKAEAQRILKVAEGELKKELLHTALTKDEQINLADFRAEKAASPKKKIPPKKPSTPPKKKKAAKKTSKIKFSKKSTYGI